MTTKPDGADDGTTSDDSLTWRTHILQSEDYEVFVWYPNGLSGAATDAPYTITHDDGDTVVSTRRVKDDGRRHPGTYLNRTHNYTYDPRDRIAEVTKTDTVAGVTLATESYVHDAANKVISQTIDGATTSYVYDRNRLLTATTDGVTATYNYDPFGRLNTVTAAGDAIEQYTYDGFDRIAEQH